MPVQGVAHSHSQIGSIHPIITSVQTKQMTDLEFSGVYLTVEEHGCVYTVCTEGELFCAPIHHDNTINLEEFDFVDFMALMGDEVDMKEQLDEIQLTLCKMMQAAGLFYTTVPV